MDKGFNRLKENWGFGSSRRSAPNPETSASYHHNERPPFTEKLKLATELYKDKMEIYFSQHKHFHPSKLLAIHDEVSQQVIEILLKCKTLDQVEIHRASPEFQRLFKQYEVKNNMSINWASSFSERIEPVVGIDLGTTNCCVAIYWDGKVTVFRNDDGDLTTPSYVSFEDENIVVVGKDAKQNAYLNPANTIFDSKRLIGRVRGDEALARCEPAWPFKVEFVQNKPRVVARGKTYAPEDISSILLKECRELASKHLQRPIKTAVITVPAYFNDEQKKATIEAARMAGIVVLQIINEPTAASLAYKIQRLYTTPRTVLVFDLGGGTFDVAVVEIGDTINTLAVDGDACLGGEDFDKELRDYCIEMFEQQTKINIKDTKANSDIPYSLVRLTIKCEEAKKVLGKKPSVNIHVDSIVTGHHLNVKVTQEIFENRCDRYFKHMIKLVASVIQAANLQKSDIEEVILVGGSTRIPKLQFMLREYFDGKELNHNVSPDEAVAFGAAVQAAILNGSDAKEVFGIKGIEDVIPMSIGIEAIVNGVEGQYSSIIPKNTKYPTIMCSEYTTSQDNQTRLSINIYQGNDQVAKNNFYLGEFLLEGIPAARMYEQKIQVVMEINNLGVLNVKAICIGSGVSRFLQVSLKKI